MRYEKATIHKVFRLFHNFFWNEIFCPNHRKRVFRGCLWNILRDRGISQYKLIKQYHISPGQIIKLKRNESVSTHTIEVFCKILQCEVGDIMKYIPDGDN